MRVLSNAAHHRYEVVEAHTQLRRGVHPFPDHLGILSQEVGVVSSSTEMLCRRQDLHRFDIAVPRYCFQEVRAFQPWTLIVLKPAGKEQSQ